MASGLSKGLRKSLLTPEPQITPFTNEPTVPKSVGNSTDGMFTYKPILIYMLS